MRNLSLTSPILHVKLYAPSGRSLDLRSWSGTPKHPSIERLQVTQQLGSANSISCTAVFEMRRFIEMIENYSDIFHPHSILEVRLGYSGMPHTFTETFQAKMLFPNAQIADDLVSLTLEARGSHYWAAKNDARKQFQGTTLYEALREVLASNGMDLYYLTKHGAESHMTVPLFGLDEVFGKEFTRNDAWIIDYIVRVKAGIQYYSNGNRFVLVSMRDTGMSAQRPSFIYGGRFDPRNGEFPLMNFSSSNDSYPLIAATHRVSSRNIDTASKVIATDARDRDDPRLNLPRTRLVGFVDEVLNDVVSSIEGAATKFIAQSRSDHGVNIPLSPNDPDAAQKVSHIKREGAALAGINSSWETTGNPLLRPGIAAMVTGCSPLYDGPYFIKSVNHTGDVNGFLTGVEGFSTGSGSGFQDLFAAVSRFGGEVSPQENTPTSPIAGDEEERSPI